MRKFFKLLISLLCFMPLFISAGTFEDGRKLANKYMQENFEDDYSRYIVSEDTKYGFSEKGIFSVSGFNKGGLINKYEFDISMISNNDSSWLYDVNGYWSLTGDDNNAYVVGKTTYPKTNVFNNRLVEYVRNKTKVSGKGTYSNPWVINKSYQVTINANRENLVDSIYHNNNKCGEDRCETNITIGKDAIFYINFKDGYEYDTSEGGANLCNASSYTASSGKLVISNVVSDIECFFKVKEKEYKITFDANGGTLTGESSKNVTYTKSYGTLPEPTREGYGFAGWFTKAVEGTQIHNSSILEEPNNQTLYAHWTPNKYTVTFDGNGGTMGSTTKKTMAYDTKYDFSGISVSRTGYTFVGWFTSASGGTQITTDTTVKITANQTLYAHWTPNKYTVTFVKNDGSDGKAGTRTVTFDSAYGTLPTITRGGYALAGWYTAASGGTQVISSTVLKTASDHKLYAHWTVTDKTAPKCTLSVSGTTITGTYSDEGGSGVAYYGYSSSMTGTSTTTKTISGAAIYTFYVKDGVGNSTTCSITVKNTTKNNTCSRGWSNGSGCTYDCGCYNGGTRSLVDGMCHYTKSFGTISACQSGSSGAYSKCVSGSADEGIYFSYWKYSPYCTTGYTTTYGCDSGFIKINDSYCYK